MRKCSDGSKEGLNYRACVDIDTIDPGHNGVGFLVVRRHDGSLYQMQAGNAPWGPLTLLKPASKIHRFIVDQECAECAPRIISTLKGSGAVWDFPILRFGDIGQKGKSGPWKQATPGKVQAITRMGAYIYGIGFDSNIWRYDRSCARMQIAWERMDTPKPVRAITRGICAFDKKDIGVEYESECLWTIDYEGVVSSHFPGETNKCCGCGAPDL